MRPGKRRTTRLLDWREFHVLQPGPIRIEVVELPLAVLSNLWPSPPRPDPVFALQRSDGGSHIRHTDRKMVQYAKSILADAIRDAGSGDPAGQHVLEPVRAVGHLHRHPVGL